MHKIKNICKTCNLAWIVDAERYYDTIREIKSLAVEYSSKIDSIFSFDCTFNRFGGDNNWKGEQ